MVFATAALCQSDVSCLLPQEHEYQREAEKSCPDTRLEAVPRIGIYSYISLFLHSVQLRGTRQSYNIHHLSSINSRGKRGIHSLTHRCAGTLVPATSQRGMGCDHREQQLVQHALMVLGAFVGT